LSVNGALGLDDGRRLIDELGQATGLEWWLEPVPTDGHLTGGVIEIVLVAVLGKSTELAYGAVLEKVRDRAEQWRREHLDKPEYTLAEETVPGADAEVGGASEQPGDPESEG
jgi:hypothetical protein